MKNYFLSMSIIGSTLLFITSCYEQIENEATMQEQTAIDVVWILYQEKFFDLGVELTNKNKPMVIHPDDKEFEARCWTTVEESASCFDINGGRLIVLKSLPPIDQFGEPVIHEAIHAAQWIKFRTIDYSHSEEVWKANGENSLQEEAQLLYMSEINNLLLPNEEM